jgi:hypothetical protein
MIKSRRLRWAGHLARMKEHISPFKILTGKSTGKIPLGSPRHKREENIRIHLKEIGFNSRN